MPDVYMGLICVTRSKRLRKYRVFCEDCEENCNMPSHLLDNLSDRRFVCVSHKGSAEYRNRRVKATFAFTILLH